MSEVVGCLGYDATVVATGTGNVRSLLGVIRLSLGKLWVNLVQVVKRTNTPLITLTNGVVDRPWVFWVVGSIPTIHNNKLFRFSPCRT